MGVLTRTNERGKTVVVITHDADIAAYAGGSSTSATASSRNRWNVFSLLLIHSFEAVKAFKLRTFFCLVSVALGISAITIIVAATEGAYKKAFDIVASFGPDSVMLMGEARSPAPSGSAKRRSPSRTWRPSARPSPRPTSSPPSWVGTATVSTGATATRARSWGLRATTAWLGRGPLVEGSDFTEDDIRRHANVGIIGQETARELFGDQSPVESSSRFAICLSRSWACSPSEAPPREAAVSTTGSSCPTRR